MRVTIRLFARLRELAGAGELEREVARRGTLSTACGRRWPPRSRRWRRTSARCQCAVNADYARMAAAVADGDEVAFLPPVSGG